MDEEINTPLNLEAYRRINLERLSPDDIPIEQFIAALQTTTTLTKLSFWFCNYKPTAEKNRRVIEPLCRCIANLRRHNKDHPLRQLQIHLAKRNEFCHVEQFLVAAKQLGIHHLDLWLSHLSIQSLEEFCRDNSNLKILEIQGSTLSNADSTVSAPPQNGPQDCSTILALDELTVMGVNFVESSVATLFSSFTARLTYTALSIGRATVRDRVYKIENKDIVMELIKPSVQQLTLVDGCPIEVIDAIEACTTVTEIRLGSTYTPSNFSPAAVQQKLQAIATRNRELACFVAKPNNYPSSDELLALMHKFDSNPTGRYMLARCFPGIPSFITIKSADSVSSTTGPKKRKRSD